ncbi:hypothetical protein AB0F17_32120 [Nonomuraea sp. NPDC026600]|uniref:hypothetical protein n=1 Tax=Nonomuraea sp. NPDC026600 TaxID=3155363 RepID=UPI0033CFA1F1
MSKHLAGSALLAGTLLITGALATAPAHASSTAHSVSTNSSVGTAQRSWVHGVYGTLASCKRAGNKLVNDGLVDNFNCVWDSPYWALWVFD